MNHKGLILETTFSRLLAGQHDFAWVEPMDGTGRRLEAGREETPGCFSSLSALGSGSGPAAAPPP